MAARPNVFIKVPGTPAGMPAIEALAAEGVNVNVTLLFSRAAYRRAAEAWMAGLEARAARGEAISGAASVAMLLGKAGIANAKLACQDFKEQVASERWVAIATRGARPQRVLFASTSVKDPRYPELMYVEALVGPETVDTVPPATLEALRRGATVRDTLEDLATIDGVRAKLGAPATL